MIVPLLIMAVFGVSVLTLWIYALVDWSKSTVFEGWSRIAWLVIIFLGSVGGAVAYLSAKCHVLRFSQPDPARLGRLLSKSR